MSVREFLRILGENLRGMTAEEKNDILEYYTEYFEEAGEENTEAVLQELGNPAKLGIRLSGECAVKALSVIPDNAEAEQDDAENGTGKSGKSMREKRTGSGDIGKTLLIILGVVIGSPLVLPAAIVALVLVIVLFAVLAVLGITAVALLVSAVVAFIGAFVFLFTQGFLEFALSVGASFVLAGVGILLLLAIAGLGVLVKKVVLALGRKKLGKGETE